MNELDRLLVSARQARPSWNEPRARIVLANVRQAKGARDARGRKTILAVSFLAAAALCFVRVAAGGTDPNRDASQESAANVSAHEVASSHDHLGLGDAGLVTD